MFIVRAEGARSCLSAAPDLETKSGSVRAWPSCYELPR